MNVTLNMLTYLREGQTCSDVYSGGAPERVISGSRCAVEGEWKSGGTGAGEGEGALAKAAEAAPPSTQTYHSTAPMTAYVD